MLAVFLILSLGGGLVHKCMVVVTLLDTERCCAKIVNIVLAQADLSSSNVMTLLLQRISPHQEEFSLRRKQFSVRPQSFDDN